MTPRRASIIEQIVDTAKVSPGGSDEFRIVREQADPHYPRKGWRRAVGHARPGRDRLWNFAICAISRR
jgi:hypothetical protein